MPIVMAASVKNPRDSRMIQFGRVLCFIAKTTLQFNVVSNERNHFHSNNSIELLMGRRNALLKCDWPAVRGQWPEGCCSSSFNPVGVLDDP